jgi:hypothetical protein
MTSDDKKLMKELGITAESMTIFYFDGHRYERLSDAINYAKTRAHPVLKPKIQHEN